MITEKLPVFFHQLQRSLMTNNYASVNGRRNEAIVYESNSTCNHLFAILCEKPIPRSYQSQFNVMAWYCCAKLFVKVFRAQRISLKFWPLFQTYCWHLHVYGLRPCTESLTTTLLLRWTLACMHNNNNNNSLSVLLQSNLF